MVVSSLFEKIVALEIGEIYLLESFGAVRKALQRGRRQDIILTALTHNS